MDYRGSPVDNDVINIPNICRTDSRPTFVASGGVDLTLKLWSFPSESDTTPMAPLRVAATEHAHDKDINSIAVAPNNKILATGSQDKTAKVNIFLAH